MHTPYEVLEATEHEYNKMLHWFVRQISMRPGPLRITDEEAEFLKMAHSGVDEAQRKYHEWLTLSRAFKMRTTCTK